MTSPPSALLTAALQMAVPLEIERMRDLPLDQVAGIGRAAGRHIAEHGDVLMYRADGTGAATAALIRGLAAAALTTWGGITYAGLHWCARRGCDGRDAHHDAPIWPDTARLAPPSSRPVQTVPTREAT